MPGAFVSFSGSAGTSLSANMPQTLPPTGMVLLATTTNPRRNSIEVQNQSAATISVALDNNTGGLIDFMLLGSAGAGAGGGDWQSMTFKGRVRVYGPAGSQVFIHED